MVKSFNEKENYTRQKSESTEKKMRSTADDNYIGKHMGFPYYY